MPARKSSGARNALAALRYKNETRIVKLLLEHPKGLTQREISEKSELARNTVSALLSERLAPILDSITLDPGERGAPPSVWFLKPDAVVALGVDIGKTHITIALIDASGELVIEPRTKFLADTLRRPQSTLRIAAEMIEASLSEAEGCGSLAGVMVGLPGVTDAGTGRMIDPESSSWQDIDVPEETEKRWPGKNAPRVWVENDANLGALGELHRGAGRGADTLLFIKWSTGIGAGIILDGRLWRGKSGFAGELGHLPVHPTRAEKEALRLPSAAEAMPCPICGQPRCLEGVAGGPALAATFGAKDFHSLVRLAASSGDESAEVQRALKAAARLIGTAVGPTLTLLNVEKVIVGGIGGKDAYPLVVESIERGVEATTASWVRSDAQIHPSELGENAYSIGAALAALSRGGPEFILSAALGDSQRVAAG